MPDFVCLGVPYWIGERAGAVNAVADVQATGIAAELNAPWVEVVAAAAAPDAVTAVNRALAAAVVAHPGRIPLIFAGDCTACIGALAGLAAQQPAVVWYDAHGDFNTPATTLSGFLGGMPLAALVGRGNEHLLAGVGLSPLPEPDIILTDARDLDAPEADALHHSQVTHLPQVEQLLTHPLPDRPLYIHFDTDVVQTAEMPAMNYPAAGGPTLAATIATVERLARDGQVAGVLFSLWNATRPGATLATHNTLRVVRALAQAVNG